MWYIRGKKCEVRTIRRPIFLHAGMRSGSTYLWAKFRELPGVMAFYEPFSEDLGRMSPTFLRHHGPDTWRSGHAPTAPYYLEYEPLLRPSGGVHGFASEFSYANYFVTQQELPAQRAYLASLLAQAEAAQTVPVLGFCRSLGRTAWLKTQFPDAVHLVLIRNPVYQWLSGWQFYTQTQNPYFLTRPLLIAQYPGDNPYMHLIAQEFREQITAPSVPIATVYEVFLHVYAASTLAALLDADLVIDIDVLSASAAYRQFITAQLTALTSLPLDVTDCRVSQYPIEGGPVPFKAINHHVVTRLLASDAAHTARPPRSCTALPTTLLTKIELSVP